MQSPLRPIRDLGAQEFLPKSRRGSRDAVSLSQAATGPYVAWMEMA
jgi:hypothetical protein